jgi:hypothetical protein
VFNPSSGAIAFASVFASHRDEYGNTRSVWIVRNVIVYFITCWAGDYILLRILSQTFEALIKSETIIIHASLSEVPIALNCSDIESSFVENHGTRSIYQSTA